MIELNQIKKYHLSNLGFISQNVRSFKSNTKYILDIICNNNFLTNLKTVD